MDPRFKAHVDRLPQLLEQLAASPSLTHDDLQHVPKQGIYVFYENERPIYVGRSNSMRQRLRNHCAKNAGHMSATFAFLLAREAAAAQGLELPKTRSACEQDARFQLLYSENKRRVGRMRIKVVEIPDQVEQTLFEVYAALALKTPYNDWHTH